MIKAKAEGTPEVTQLIFEERTNTSNELSSQIQIAIQTPQKILDHNFGPEFPPEDPSRYINLEDKDTPEKVQAEIDRILIAEKDNERRNVAIDGHSNRFVSIFNDALNATDSNFKKDIESFSIFGDINEIVLGGFNNDPSAIQEVFNSTYNKLGEIIANAPPEKAERLKKVLEAFEEGEKRAMTMFTKGVLKQNQSYYEPVKDSLLKNNDSINHLIEEFKANGNNINANLPQSLKDQLTFVLGEKATLRETATALSKIYNALNNIPNLSPESQMAKDILNTIQETIANRYPDPEIQSKLYLMTSSYSKKQLSKSKTPILASQLSNKFIESSLENVLFKTVDEINKDVNNPKYTMNYSTRSAILSFAKKNREFISTFDPSLTDTFTKSFGKALYKVDKLRGTPNNILLDLTKDSKSFVKEADVIIELSLDILKDETLSFKDKCDILTKRMGEFANDLLGTIKGQEIKDNLLTSCLTELSKAALKEGNGEFTPEAKITVENIINKFVEGTRNKAAGIIANRNRLAGIIEDVPPFDVSEIDSIANSITQFALSEKNSYKPIENISLICQILSGYNTIPLQARKQIIETLYNKVLSLGNPEQIECLLEHLPEMREITKTKKELIEDVIVSSDKNKIVGIFTNATIKQEFKKDIIDILLDPTKITNPAIAKSKDYLNKINQVLEETLPTLILTTPELPLDKIFKLNPKLAENKYVFEAICSSDKAPFKNFKLISEKRTLNEEEIINFIIKTPDRIKDVEEQQQEVLQTIKLISQRKGLSKPISKLREEDIKKLADLFAKNPDILTDEIKTTLKNNLDSRLFNTFNNELQQQTQQNINQPQQNNQPQPIILANSTRIQENRERQGQTNSNELQ
jgi:hypothetical protein